MARGTEYSLRPRPGLAQGPKGPAPLGGDTLARRLVGVGVFTLGVPPRVVLPDARGPLEVLVGTSRESWENSILLLPECLDDQLLANLFQNIGKCTSKTS